MATLTETLAPDQLHGGVSPLPREIVKWLQSLDLSFNVKNPKRDFANGFIIAEILSRYYTKDISMSTFENGTRLSAKVDNWEQLFKFFRRRGIGIQKSEIDPVIHCAPGAATSFIFHLYNVLTNRSVKVLASPAGAARPAERPAYTRDTASRRLKDHEIHRIQDNVERTIRAFDALGNYHEERRSQKAMEAPMLIQAHREMRMAMEEFALEDSSKEEQTESQQIDEVRVKAMAGVAAQGLRGKADRGEQQNKSGGKGDLLKAVSQPRTSVGPLAAMQQPALFVKPAADIMRPLVLSIIQESEELSKMIDTRKDIVVSFMEQCRVGISDSAGKDPTHSTSQPIEHKMRDIEETSVRVFETLAKRAQLLVDTLTKSPPEFWKVWTTFYPALTDFSESSPIFESAVFLFKSLGDLMREADAQLTQQLITEVGLPSLAKELLRAPEKREAICEIIYSYTQEDTLNHLLVLRSLKEKLQDNLPVYVSCLSCLISVDAQLSLLDEHLLDLYIYYALIAMQNAQPRVRVAGICILSTITTCTSQHHSILGLIANVTALANDEWWEVQAQLLLLCTHLLRKLSRSDLQDGAFRDTDDENFNEGQAAEDSQLVAEAAENLLAVIGQLFVVSSSKNVLQVGLSCLVHLLGEYPPLLPIYVTVLLEQPTTLRQRLLQNTSEADQPADRTVGRLTYVMGNASRMYEEKCISMLWPHLDVAKTFTMQLEAAPVDHFELEHMEVFFGSLPEHFEEENADEWLSVFDKVSKYIFVALIDNALHSLSTQIIKRFWICDIDKIATKSIEHSKNTLSQALRLLYSNAPISRVDETSMIQFLTDLCSEGGNLQFEVRNVIEAFRETHPAEFESSQLASLLGE